MSKVRLFLSVGSVSLCFSLALSVAAETGKPGSAAAGKAAAVSSDSADKSVAQVNALIKEAQIAELGGQDADAGEKYKAAIKLAQESSASKLGATALMAANAALAESMSRQNQLAEQLPYRQEAVSVAEKTFGKDSTQYAEQIANLGSYYGGKGEGAEARRLVDQSSAILKGDEAKHPLELACGYMATARRQVAEGTFGLADDSFIKARQLRESKGGKDDVIGLLYCLEHSRLLQKIDRKEEARQLQQKIISFLALYGTAGGGTTAKAGGKETQSAFSKLVVQAKAAETAKDYDKALELWKMAASEAEKAGQGAKYAYAMVHLGDQYRFKKELAQAVVVYKKSLEAREKAGATETLGMCRNLERIGQCYLQDQKPADAQAPLVRALELEKKLSADPAIQAPTMQYVMTMYLSSKNNSGAEGMAKQILNLPDTAGSTIAMKKQTARASLGGIYMQSGRMQEGMEMLKSIIPPTGNMGQELAKAFQAEYTHLEKLFDDAEEKEIGL